MVLDILRMTSYRQKRIYEEYSKNAPLAWGMLLYYQMLLLFVSLRDYILCLKQYEDLEDISRKQTWMDPRVRHVLILLR